MMDLTTAQIAEMVGGTLTGRGDARVTGFCSLDRQAAGGVAFLDSARESGKLVGSPLAALITRRELAGAFADCILVDNPRLAFVKVMEAFIEDDPAIVAHERVWCGARPSPGGSASVHPTACIAASAKIGEGAQVHANCFVDEDAEIGAGAVLFPGVFVGRGSKIGEGSRVYANVTIYGGVTIGKRVIIHAGSVIGSDGFGFIPGNGHRKFPQAGGVAIGDGVEIGACVTVDRGALDDTVIGRGTKIDNLVQVGHNVIIGEDCLIAAQAGFSGGTVIGDRCVIGGQAGFNGHVTVGANTTVSAQAGVFGNLPAGSKVSGFPARPHQQTMRVLALAQRLPDFAKSLKSLSERIAGLERRLQNTNRRRRGGKSAAGEPC
jgi:UDP-3-O-[3-hydroxymyristoyl] glucosamine N-acyltransferase